MARGFLLQNRLGLGPHIGAPGGQELWAQANLLVVRYPVEIDTPPAMSNDVAPLSGIFHNYAALMLEAIMAEVGPLADLPKPGTLLAFLGVEAANRISNWRSKTKTYGGNEAGQIYGLTKQHKTNTPLQYAVKQIASFTTFQGQRTKLPVGFGAVDGTGKTNNQMVVGVGGPMLVNNRGHGGSDVYSYEYRGSPAGKNPGAPVGTFAQPADLLFLYLWEGM